MFIISEISPQFSGKVEVAEQMILQSKLAGADAIKVQLYTDTQFGSERAYLSMSFEDLKRLKIFADNLNIPLFATPFTFDRLDWCIKLNLPYLKVAARMHLEMPDLVKEIMKQKIQTFVSIPSDLNPSKVEKFDHATYLYCVVKYPTRLDEFSMPDFQKSCFKGVSDHTLGNSGALFASAHGAMFLEKHFTLQQSHQYITEQAHLGSMNMHDLTLIKNISKEFEIIRNI
ncbi:MAG: N-acetylneuraminate synthase family protein [Flavobacteriales bacterium]|nr:N-acetylneuraminate synthase family protein [Flavobacteriales bacterium]